jgi:hypothetical protein
MSRPTTDRSTSAAADPAAAPAVFAAGRAEARAEMLRTLADLLAVMRAEVEEGATTPREYRTVARVASALGVEL